MDCKITSTKPAARRTAAGFLLAEAMVTIMVVSVLLVAIVAFMLFSTRSFTTMYNYVDLDDRNRIAMDQLTRDVRQCKRVIACSTNQLVLEDADGLSLSYNFRPATSELVRQKNGGDERVILMGCDRLNFQIGQRNAMKGSYDIYPAATPANAKVVNVSWVCSRTIFGRKENTESVQTARIVIRKQGT